MYSMWVGVSVRVPADTADKALGVVRASQSGDYLSRDEAVTAVAARAVQTLVVGRADVLALLLEEAGSGQITVTHCGEKVKNQNAAACTPADLWMSCAVNIS